MAEIIRSTSEINGRVILALSEAEAKALKTITSYGPDPFIRWFYANLGKSYLNSDEAGLRSLFETVGKELPKHLDRFNDARKAFSGQYRLVDKRMEETINKLNQQP